MRELGDGEGAWLMRRGSFNAKRRGYKGESIKRGYNNLGSNGGLVADTGGRGVCV